MNGNGFKQNKQDMENKREWPEKNHTMLNDRDSNPPRSSTPRLCRRTFLCRGRVGSASAPSTTSSQQQPGSWTRIKITPNLTALDSQRQLSVKKDQKAHSSKKN